MLAVVGVVGVVVVRLLRIATPSATFAPLAALLGPQRLVGVGVGAVFTFAVLVFGRRPSWLWHLAVCLGFFVDPPDIVHEVAL